MDIQCRKMLHRNTEKNDAGMRQGRNHDQPPSSGGVSGGVAYLVDLEFSRGGWERQAGGSGRLGKIEE